MSYENKIKEKLYQQEYHKNNPKKLKRYIEKFYKIHPKKNAEYQRKFQLLNKGYGKKYQEKFHREHPEKNAEYQRKFYKQNKNKIKIYMEKYRKDNKEILNRYSNQYRKNNKEKQNKRARNRRRIDLKYNLDNRIRVAIWQSLKGNKNGRHWEGLVGYSLNDLMKHLIKTIPEGYIWQDYFEGKLHIDHIIPISAFNFTKPEHIDFKRCWALNNLRLFPAKENHIKYNKLNKPFQPSLKIS
jgi:5-methylcytosine-specific restriction endonuclease McrA